MQCSRVLMARGVLVSLFVEIGIVSKYQPVVELARTESTVLLLCLLEGAGGFLKPCIVKRLRAQALQDPRAREVLFAEGVTGAQVQHANVGATFDTGEYDVGNGLRVPFVALEYVDGASLHAIAHASSELGVYPSSELILRMISDALSGLHALHEASDLEGRPLKMVHRRLRPRAVRVGYDGRTRIVDLSGAVVPETRTSRDVLLGESGYMAPEYVATRQSDRRGDVFSMGVVLWELLAGRRVPGAHQATPVMMAPLPPVSTRVPALDARLDALVARAVAPDPERRYDSALDFQEAIDSYLQSASMWPRATEIGALVQGYFADARERRHKALAEAAMEVRAALGAGGSGANVPEATGRRRRFADTVMPPRPRTGMSVRPSGLPSGPPSGPSDETLPGLGPNEEEGTAAPPPAASGTGLVSEASGEYLRNGTALRPRSVPVPASRR